MTTTAHKMHGLDTSVETAGYDTEDRFDALKLKAANAFSSPYVVGSALLGIGAAGYAFMRRKKNPPVDLPRKSGDRLSDIVQVGGLLVSLVSTFASTRSSDQVEPTVILKETEPGSISSDLSRPEEKDVAQGSITPPRPLLEQTSSSWTGCQWQICKAAGTAWMDDYAPSMGAALSYYTLFSLAPLLVLVIAIAGIVFGQDAAQGAIIAQLQSIMGEEGASAVQGLLKAAREPSTGIVASIVGGFLLLLGATAIFAELQSDLDRIWRVPAKAKPSGLWGWLRSRILSFGLVLGLAFMLMISLVVSAALAASSAWIGGGTAAESVLANVLNFAASLALFTVLFAMIYKIMPTAKISWHDVWMGSAVTALLFNVGKSLIGLYIAKSGVASGFGAAGSFVILVAWFYYSAQIFLFGAEYTWVYANSKTGSTGGLVNPRQ